MALFSEHIRTAAFNRLTARNYWRQKQYLKDITDLILRDLPQLKLRGDIVSTLNFHATAGITTCPGILRKEATYIEGSAHKPPDPDELPDLFSDFIVNVCEIWEDFGPFDLAAYVLWRLTWLHPFEDANGRTADSTAYYVLCKKLGFWAPGENTIPAYWRENKDERYYNCLRKADSRGIDSPESCPELSTLLQRALMNQLLSVEYDG